MTSVREVLLAVLPLETALREQCHFCHFFNLVPSCSMPSVREVLLAVLPHGTQCHFVIYLNNFFSAERAGSAFRGPTT